MPPRCDLRTPPIIRFCSALLCSVRPLLWSCRSQMKTKNARITEIVQRILLAISVNRESAEEKRKYVARPGIEPGTSGS